MVFAGVQDDVATSSAVPTAGPAARYVFLPPERQDAVAAVACLYLDPDFIDEPRVETPKGRRVAPTALPKNWI